MINDLHKRHYLITLLVIIFSLLIIVLDLFSPFKPINYNDEQITKIDATPPSDHFSFAVMGDTHDGYTVFEKILDDIDSGHYIFALDIGDIVPYGRKDYFRIFLNMINKIKTPFLAGIGNHDLDNLQSARVFSKIFGNTYYAFHYSNSLFIVLDNSNKSRIDSSQMIWLEDQLQKKYKHTFVFMHVPPFDPINGENHCLSDRLNAQAIMSLMEKYSPDMVFTGHIHGYFDEFRNNVHYVITGGSGKMKWNIKDDHHYFNHYIKVDVTGDKITKNAVRIISDNRSIGSDNSLWTLMIRYWEGNKIFATSIIILLLALFDASIFIIRKTLSIYS